MIRIREMKIDLSMLVQLEKCRNELGWLVRYEECIVSNCPESDFPPMSLPIPPGYTKKWRGEWRWPKRVYFHILTSWF